MKGEESNGSSNEELSDRRSFHVLEQVAGEQRSAGNFGDSLLGEQHALVKLGAGCLSQPGRLQQSTTDCLP